MITRFAPSPTGYLHLGHVLNAIAVWGLAAARGGTVLVRIEDHDRQRCRPEYERSILDDLDWLGFRAAEVSRQRDREAVYRAAIARLRAQGLVYGCTCSRAHLERPPGSTESRYPGRCRDRGVPLDDGVGWRLRIDPGEERFDDLWQGPQAQDPAVQCGDLLLRDRLGNWTYQLAVAADDTAQGVTDVIRGLDLLASTGRQIRLARLLGRDAPPRFAHHALVMKSPTEKLSKSDGDTGVRDLARAGWTPERVIGAAAWRGGLVPEPSPLAAADVGSLFLS
ncbi:MAG: glutamate--tRNA ligase family protein [Acidobacteriota bacterium]